MSRHRNVRSMNYEDEYYDEDDYGHSVEDNYCISPGTAAQFTFNRDHNVALSSFMDEQGGIPEEDEEVDDEGTPREAHRSSLDYTRPQLNDVDEAKLNSVLEEVRNVLGDTVPEHVMVDTIMRHNFSVEGSLNEMLEAPKPQREPRRDRRNRSQEFDVVNDVQCSVSPSSNNVFSCNPNPTSGLMKFGDKCSPNFNTFPLIVQQQCAVVSKDKVVKVTDNQNEQLNNNAPEMLVESNFKHTGKSAGKVALSELAKSNKTYNVKLSELAKTNQSEDAQLSDLAKTNQTGRVKLSDLAKSNQSAGMKLSDLAKNSTITVKQQCAFVSKDEIVKTPDNQNMTEKLLKATEKISLSELAKTNQCGSIRMLDLAKSNHSEAVNLSKLLKPDQNMETKMLDISKDQTLNKNGISVALSELAKTHLTQSSKNMGAGTIAGKSPLSSLATAHLGSSPVSSMTVTRSPGSTQLSSPSNQSSSPLSQLAKLDAQNTPTQHAAMKPGLSLAQLAEAHGVKKSPHGSPASFKDNKENIDQGNKVSGLLKNKTDTNQIMSSLSSLIADKKPIQVNQQCAISVPKSDVSKIASSSTSIHSKSPTLMDLVKKPGLHTQKKQSVELPSKRVEEKETSGPTDYSETLPDLKNPDENIDNIDTQNLSESLVFIDDVPLESLKHLMNKSSTLGHSLCLVSAVKSQKSCKKSYRWKRFGYRYQTNGRVLQPCMKMNKIIPYDFSGPSPDDIVKSKQKLAFKRP